MKQRPVILGMNSPIPGCLHPDIPGSAGTRLFEITGMSLEAYEAAFERRNLLDNSKMWYAKKARRIAPSVLRTLAGRTVIVLGAEVWRALGFPLSVIHVRREKDGSQFYRIPHPSGRSRFYNDPKARKYIGSFLRSMAE